ncbi:hypothetical protein FLACOL7796_04206 [Flavobacterium collinsii]|uniref:Uncharacterized protein n=1 Tax=Flavobacterium collinsii TaxID=1114861 RepID=A0ABM8KNZ4_9FLAO|nr:hypothetical protein FLACOL7796_04206 [Flavobacterium collinsii]
MLNLNQRFDFFNNVLIFTELENRFRKLSLFQYFVFYFFAVISSNWNGVRLYLNTIAFY